MAKEDNNGIYWRLDRYIEIIKAENKNYLQRAKKTQKSIKAIQPKHITEEFTLQSAKKLTLEDIAIVIFSEEAAELLINVATKYIREIARRIEDKYGENILGGDYLTAKREIAKDYLHAHKGIDLSPFYKEAIEVVKKGWAESP
ncbi:MAG: hypothetical protein ABIH72_00210 [archaeon]